MPEARFADIFNATRQVAYATVTIMRKSLSHKEKLGLRELPGFAALVRANRIRPAPRTTSSRWMRSAGSFAGLQYGIHESSQVSKADKRTLLISSLSSIIGCGPVFLAKLGR